MKVTIQRNCFRPGLIREEIRLRNGRRHGVARTWHKNGRLASEEPYRDGLLHGICRQWDESGKLLGKYKMVHGTGVQRSWHANGRLQIEVSTAQGEFSGRNRIWLRDGTLLSERFYVLGHLVSAAGYRAATKKDSTLPKYQSKPTKLPAKSLTTPRHIHRLLVISLLEKPNQSEAAGWLISSPDKVTARVLGRLKRKKDAARLVESLYKAGAKQVIAADIYANKKGDHFTDCLLVRLPGVPGRRKAIRRACAKLRRRGTVAVQPDRDIGESHLYIYLA